MNSPHSIEAYSRSYKITSNTMSLMITMSYVKLKPFPHRFKKYLRRRENESDAASHLNVQYLEIYILSLWLGNLPRTVLFVLGIIPKSSPPLPLLWYI